MKTKINHFFDSLNPVSLHIFSLGTILSIILFSFVIYLNLFSPQSTDLSQTLGDLAVKTAVVSTLVGFTWDIVGKFLDAKNGDRKDAPDDHDHNQ